MNIVLWIQNMPDIHYLIYLNRDKIRAECVSLSLGISSSGRQEGL